MNVNVKYMNEAVCVMDYLYLLTIYSKKYNIYFVNK